jgi:hypothetical protein
MQKKSIDDEKKSINQSSNQASNLFLGERPLLAGSERLHPPVFFTVACGGIGGRRVNRVTQCCVLVTEPY